MSARWVVLVARPAPAGIDHRSVAGLADAVRPTIADPVHVAHLDQASPSVPDVLDDALAAGIGEALLVPLAVPADGYLTSWLARTVANWHETRIPAALDVRISDGLATAPGLVAAVVDIASGAGTAITASPAAFRSPAWSVIPAHSRHLLVCRGPRCTAYGAGATYRALSRAARGTDTLVTPTGCFGPCNLGPLVVEHPGNTWHRNVTEEHAPRLP